MSDTARRPCSPRWTFHFTPTSASWLNAVEGFFATLTKRRLKRSVFRSVSDFQAAINRFLEEHNQQSQPFTWTADPDKIIVVVSRYERTLGSPARTAASDTEILMPIPFTSPTAAATRCASARRIWASSMRAILRSAFDTLKA
jgi:hypothetical protein